MISKSLQITKIEKSDETVRFIASTGSTDRYGDIIDQNGWELEAYRRNPVVLLNHQTNQLPIGKGTVEVVDGNLMIDVQFDKEDELAQKVEHKAKNGFMHAVSVGFNPVEAINRSELPEEHKAYSKRGGNYFTKAELLEVSVVTIPANSEATTMGTKQMGLRGMIREILVQEIRHILEVEELDDAFRVTYAKHEMEEEEEERVYHDEEEEMKEHDPEHGDDHEKEKGGHMDEEEDREMDEDKEEQKSFDALITLLAQERR